MSNVYNKIEGMGEEKGALSSFDGGMQGHDRRGTLHVLFLHIGIRIKYFLESWFFLKPLLLSDISAYPSMLRPKGIPKIDWPTLFGIRMLWTIGAFARQHQILLFFFLKIRLMHLLGWIHTKLMDRICHIMKESGINWEKAREIRIPEYDWKNGNPDEFFKTFTRTPHPVVLRGFLKGTTLMKDYTFDKIVERFGEETVILTRPDKDGYVGKLKEVLNPNIYLHNSEVLFNKYPEVAKDLETEKLNPYLRKESGYAQLFVGRQGTGAPLHNAGTWNFFHMVDGTKKWYFIDPYDYYLAYPMWFAGHSANIISSLYPDQFDKKLFPAFQYCPYYVADLQPGDVLLNPPWWGHGIRNTSDKSVGVATRWYENGTVGHNFKTMENNYDICRFASFIFLSGPKSYPFLQDVLYEPSPRFDEHITLREKHGRFIHRQKELAKGAVSVEGWRPTF